MSAKTRILVFLVFLLFNFADVAAAQNPSPPIDQEALAFSDTRMEIGRPAGLSSGAQFTASGHVLSFHSGEIYLASADHALRIEFVGANRVNPVIEQAESNKGVREVERSESPTASQAAPLGRVTYAHLWEGVTLEYQRSDQGVVKSTYRIEPPIQEHLSKIHLRYNTGIELLPDGSLSLKYDTGQMVESAPVAWQEANGERLPVQAAFHRLGDGETGFTLQGKFDPSLPLVIDPVLIWTSFLGSSGNDYGNDVAVDGSGNVYVLGNSYASWGSPLNPHAGGYDVFVAKLNSSGALQWNTFLGSNDYDWGEGIFVDGFGNVYITGASYLAWGGGMTVDTHSTGRNKDAFAAKLDASGALVWNTFMGGSTSYYDEAYAIAMDSEGNVIVAGFSDATWGDSPVNTFAGGGTDGFCVKLSNSGVRQWHTFLGSSDIDRVYGIATYGVGVDKAIYLSGYSKADWGTAGSYVGGEDAFIAKLNGSGARQWNLFLGSTDSDRGYGVAMFGSANPYLTGTSYATWGFPVNAFSGSPNAFTAKISSSGSLQWNTFIGDESCGEEIAIDSSGIYVAGYASHSWGSPVNPHAGNEDGFVAMLNGSGEEQWHTFMGSSENDYTLGVAVRSGSVYVAGNSYASWGSPVKLFASSPDAFAAKMNASDGVRQWNTFMGSKGSDYGRAIALDAYGNIYVAGYSNASWGSPVDSYTGGWEAFVTKLSNQGYRVWSTFLGSASDDYAYGIAVYGSDVYVVGSSTAAWGVGTYHGGARDAFVAKLDGYGVRQWNVFLGDDGDDQGYAVSADASGVYASGYLTESGSGSEILVARLNSSGGTTWSTNYGSASADIGYAIVTDASETVYVAGMSGASWGSDPVNDYTGGFDAVVAALASSDGFLQWNTFLGSSGSDYAFGIDLDGSGNIYLAGISSATWGDPVTDFTSGGYDAYAASLDDEGTLRWNTFMGSSAVDQGFAVFSRNLGDVVYVVGYSDDDWGSPIYPYQGGSDAFVARFDSSDGEREWSAFLGSVDDDIARGIAVDVSGSPYLAGSSQSNWGIQNYYHAGDWDAFVARLAPFGLTLPIVKR